MHYRIKIALLSFVILVTGIQAAEASARDSVRTVKRKGKVYVIHKVEKGNTLFSLSQRYGCSVDAIKQANSKIAANGLKIGKKIKVPYGKAESSSADSESAGDKVKYHKVKSGQTLYSISQKYGATVDQIRKWNNLEGNNIEVGQNLKVSKGRDSGKNASSVDRSSKNSGMMEEDQASKDTIKGRFKKKVRKTKTLSGYNKVVEVGMGQTFTSDNTTGKYEALHSSAEIGNILEITNRKTGERVFVRVVGKLKDTGKNKDLVVKISEPAREKIGLKGDVFKVEVSYIP